MMIETLDHFTVATNDLDASRGFYVGLLGLVEGERPPFETPGAWLYGGAAPLVHLVVREGGGAASTGALDHIAFRARGLADMVARLEAAGLAYRLQRVPGPGLRQVFVTDPDGVRVELTFAADERLPGEA
ncbi:MAG: VOC family protein [Alphaproteobacteria bacterium]